MSEINPWAIALAVALVIVVIFLLDAMVKPAAPLDDDEQMTDFGGPARQSPARSAEQKLQDIINALDRQATTLEAMADALARQLDYGAEFPAEDARLLREAAAIVAIHRNEQKKG